MYPHFIEIHNGKLEILVNIESIKFVCPHPAFLGNGEIHYSGLSNNRIITEESYDEVKKLIKDCGCHIQMGDPRLDNKPLTVDRLKDMIGDPIWDSNKQAWGLVCDYFDGLVRIRPFKGATYDYNADDLIKFPVYSMKIE